jgi:hypothetical protein
MKDQCATFSGPIQMIDADGAYHQEELGTLSGRISQRLSITTTG